MFYCFQKVHTWRSAARIWPNTEMRRTMLLGSAIKHDVISRVGWRATELDSSTETAQTTLKFTVCRIQFPLGLQLFSSFPLSAREVWLSFRSSQSGLTLLLFMSCSAEERRAVIFTKGGMARAAHVPAISEFTLASLGKTLDLGADKAARRRIPASYCNHSTSLWQDSLSF